MTPTAQKLARFFHETYEEFAPSFGYETRKDTKAFEETTPNGLLMVAVCEKVLDWIDEKGLTV